MTTAKQIIDRFNQRCADIAKLAIYHNGKIKFVFKDDSCIISTKDGYSEQNRDMDIKER